MALVTEDGTGLSTAESYISIADADTYIAAFKSDVTAWDAASTANKEIYARQATQYIDGVFNFKGVIEFTIQALEFPRESLYDSRGAAIDGIPTKLEQATAEVMYLIIGGTTISVNVDRNKQIKSKKVDVIETEWISGASQQPSFPEVNRLLSEYVNSSGRLSRG